MTENNTTPVKGIELRRLRKQTFKSAEAFSAACESVSVPTIYRAERGGPILKSYLNRMARMLGVEADRLIPPLDADGKAQVVDLTGEWLGHFLLTDRFGHPCILSEDAVLTQIDETVEARMVYRENNETMIDVYENARFKDNVLCGQLRSEKWSFPLECGAFVLSGGRSLSWLDGYLSWFDLDSEKPQFSKYILIRKGTDSFDADAKKAHRILEDEMKLLRTRRFLESGYNFETSLSLVTASEEPSEETASIVPDKASLDIASAASASLTSQIALALTTFSVDESEQPQQFFADGLVDDIATELVSASNIDVLPRSIFPKDQLLRPEDAAKRGATHVLSGTVRRSQDKLLVNAQLIDTETSRVIWAERYNHAPETAFAMYTVIVSDICRALNQTQTSDAQTRAKDTTNPHAYELFLKAKSLYLRGMYVHSLRAAEALLQRVINLDGNFARAHAQLSICRTYLLQSIQTASTDKIELDGVSDAKTALGLNPDLPLGHAAIGLAHYASGDYQRAETSLLTAIDQDPTLFEPQFFLARNRRLQGDRAGATDRLKKAVRLRPDDFRAAGLLAEEEKALGNDEEAEAAFWNAKSLVERELEDHPDNAGALAFGAAVLAHIGLMDRARIWAEWAITIAPNDCLVHYNIARMYALDGSKKKALDHLAKAYLVPKTVQRRLAFWMRYDNDFETLAKDKTFLKLDQKVSG